MNKVASQTEHKTTSKLLPVSGFLQRKCACGNHMIGGGECAECNKTSKSLQTKLRVSQSGDHYEQEADRLAEQVMRMSAPSSDGAHLDFPSSLSIQRKPSHEGREEPGTSLVDNVISSPGQPLDPATRAFFEPRFGRDFSQVRVHADDRAAESASSVHARAYTVGEHIVFGARQFGPSSTEGQRLLAHELTHVIQQGGADFTIQPEEETEDSGLQRDETLSAERTPRSSFPQVTPTLSSGLMLQRAACPCCADSISIGNISRIDTPARMGHNFDVDIGLSYPTNGPSGSCTLEWWEKTNVPYHPRMPANTWTDMFALVPTSPTFAPWRNRSEGCGISAPVKITDVPSLGRSPGRTVTRTLEFRIVVNSMPPTSESGCGSATQQVTATQVLTMVSGAPDWAASSFTTP